MGEITHLSTDELIKLLDSVYQHIDEKTVTIGKDDKQLMYDLLDKKFYTATPFNIWDTIDPVKGIEDHLLSTKPDYALSANQGRVLKELHDVFYDEYTKFVEHVEESFIEVHEALNVLDERVDAIETEIVTKSNYKFYKSIAERDADIPNVSKGTIAISEIGDVRSVYPRENVIAEYIAFNDAITPDIMSYRTALDEDDPKNRDFNVILFHGVDTNKNLFSFYYKNIRDSDGIIQGRILFVNKYFIDSDGSNKITSDTYPIWSNISFSNTLKFIDPLTGLDEKLDIHVDANVWYVNDIISTSDCLILYGAEVVIPDFNTLFIEGKPKPHTKNDVDISILNESKVYIKDTTFASKSEFDIFKEDVTLNKANTDLSNVDNHTFKNKGIDAGLLYRIPQVNQEAVLYINEYDALRELFIVSEVKPTTDINVDWTIDPNYNSRTFEFRHNDFIYLSTSDRYTLSLHISNMEVDADYNVTAETCYDRNGIDWTIGTTNYTTRFPKSSGCMEIPLESNHIFNEVELAPENRFYIKLSIKKASGTSETITINSTVGEPSKLIRNSTSLSSNNVFDCDGTNTKSLAYRLHELQASHNEFIPKTEKRQPNGVACLDENGKVHVDELPNFILGQVLFGGTLINVNGQCTVSDGFKSKYGKDNFTITSSNANEVEGTYFIASITGTIVGLNIQIGDWIISNGVHGWAKIANTDAVTMVNGRVGNIILSKSDVELNNVDNTADANKRVSYANTAGSAPASDVYSWAKQPIKPAYNADEVGAVAVFANGKTNSIYSQYIMGGGNCRPIDLESYSTTVRMGSNIGGEWCDQIMMDAYMGADVPYRTAFAIKKQAGIQAFVATGHITATSWNVAELWHTQNLDPIHKNIWNNMPGEAGKTYLGQWTLGGAWTMRQSIGFQWYDSNVGIGILRGSGTDSVGIGFYIKDSIRALFDNNGALNCHNVIFSSDENIKENFKSFDDIDIDDIRLEWFNMKDDKNTKRFGVIAQDVMKYLPEFISGKEWSEEEPNRHLSVANIDLLFLMIAKLRKDVKELKQNRL